MRLTEADLAAAEILSNIPARALARVWLLQTAASSPVSAEHVEIHDHRAEAHAERHVAAKSGHDRVRRTVCAVAANMPDRERDIIMTVLTDHEARSQRVRDMARKYDRTVSRIRQIVRSGINDIRAALAEDGLTAIDDII